MIVKKSCVDKNKSRYICDMCHKIIDNSKRKGIYVSNKENRPIKKCDLCLECYKSLVLHVKKIGGAKDGSK